MTSSTSAWSDSGSNVDHYNFDVSIPAGYRANAHRGTQFCIWVAQRLRELIIGNFTLGDARMKPSGVGYYFQEHNERMRDICFSECPLRQKSLDICATCFHYDSLVEISKNSFASVHNKPHWPVHEQTAAEVIFPPC
jgi:hypothetical protein